MIAIDYALAFLWLALTIKNRAALLPLFVLLVDCALYSPLPDLHRHATIAALCWLFSATALTPNYLRNPLLAAGSLYWVGAFDELLYTYFDLSTVYYDVMPYLVIMLNAYIALVLLQGGGLTVLGLLGDLAALLIAGALGYNCFNRVQLIIKANRDAQQKRAGECHNRIQSNDDE